MAISVNRVTRMGLDGGIWRPAGDFSTKQPGVINSVPTNRITVVSADRTTVVSATSRTKTVTAS